MEDRNEKVETVSEDMPKAAEETTPVVTVAPEPKPRKRKARATRDNETLHSVSPGTMTDTEKKNYIIYLREELLRLQTMMGEFEQSAKSAFAKVQQLENDNLAFRNKANLKFHNLRESIKNIALTANLLGNLDD